VIKKKMVGIMDLNDEKDNIDDILRDKEVYAEKLQRAQIKREMALDMIEEAESEMHRLRLSLDECDKQIKALLHKQVLRKERREH